MKLSDFDYTLPEELIAQEPIEERSSSKLLVLTGERIEHRRFTDILDYLSRGDTLVINDSKVIPARLTGKKATGGKVSVLLIEKDENDDSSWDCLLKGKNIKDGTLLHFKNLCGKVIGKKGSRFKIRFDNTDNFERVLEKIGEMPTPPYIKKALEKKDRYQTVYAREPGSIAAPTAGLHFTKELISSIKKRGVNIAEVTLHVGIGTFTPVKSMDIAGHRMEAEYFKIEKRSADIINNTKGKLIIVGTTTVRALESACNGDGRVNPVSGLARVFIYPPYRFKTKADGLITNFHLPRSTLLMMVSAFAGRERILNAYKAAIEKRYRFYSFGDAMLIFR